MAEKIEFDLAVKNNQLDKALETSVSKTEDLEAGLKSAIALLSKPSIGASFQKSLTQNTLTVREFKDGAAAGFAIAKKGAEEASVVASGLNSQLKNSTSIASGLGNALQGAFSSLLLNPVVLATTAIIALVASFKEAAGESLNFKRAQLEIETILPKNE
jgi:hypothetical protein